MNYKIQMTNIYKKKITIFTIRYTQLLCYRCFQVSPAGLAALQGYKAVLLCSIYSKYITVFNILAVLLKKCKGKQQLVWLLL